MSGTAASTTAPEPVAPASAAAAPLLPPAGAGWGGGGGGAAEAFLSAGGGAAASPAPSPSSTTTTLPSDTVSPTLIFSSRTTPACEDGTSIVALSDSSVTRPWSFATVSPTATSTSITGTSS